MTTQETHHSRTSPIRLIATDLDGTFLSSYYEASPVNIEAVRRAGDLGVPTVFATGRPWRWLDPLKGMEGAHRYVITSNGGLIVDLPKQEIVHGFPLDRDMTNEVIADVREHVPGAMFAVENIHGWAREEPYPHWEGIAQADLVVPLGGDLLVDDTTIKLLIRNGQSTSDLLRQVEPLIKDRLTLTVSLDSEDGFLELSQPGVSKGTTLNYLLGELGIDPGEVAAFGDMPNDLTMLELVGYPFIVDNAADALKSQGFPTCGRFDESAFGLTVSKLLGLGL
ncbi:MAG: Cof-type HAD-IIB family hydrolase [Propionibacteriaceae bacterium]|nr:Cof-type HAD-IIB family hydrolase [Propionibacteriaceae bacterium]